MIQISRSVLSLLVLAFGLFLNILGLFHLNHFANLPVALAAQLLYLGCLLITVFASREVKLPLWATLTNMAILFVIPILVHASHTSDPLADGDTWYVTAVAVIVGSMAVRKRQSLAIASGLVLVAEVLLLSGIEYLAKSGITGAVLLIISAITISRGLDRSAIEIEKFQNQTMVERRETALVQTARQEHRNRIDSAIARVMPTLKEISHTPKLSKSQREAAAQLAQELDDEISGGRLATPAMKKAIAKARAKSIEVTILDESDFATEEQLDDLLDLAIAAIETISVGRIKLIALKDGPYQLRLTATRPGVVTPDLDLKLGER